MKTILTMTANINPHIVLPMSSKTQKFLWRNILIYYSIYPNNNVGIFLAYIQMLAHIVKDIASASCKIFKVMQYQFLYEWNGNVNIYFY